MSLALVIAAVVMVALLYDRLPDPFPTHWDSSGQVDGFTRKPWGPFLLPAVMAALVLSEVRWPRRAPLGLEAGRPVIVAFLFVVTALSVSASVGAPVDLERAVHAAAGLLLIVMARFVAKLAHHGTAGVRTPWTLASQEVWLRTHRLAGWLCGLAGAMVLGSGLLGSGALVPLVALATAAALPVPYSYFLHRRLEGRRP